VTSRRSSLAHGVFFACARQTGSGRIGGAARGVTRQATNANYVFGSAPPPFYLHATITRKSAARWWEEPKGIWRASKRGSVSAE